MAECSSSLFRQLGDPRSVPEHLYNGFPVSKCRERGGRFAEPVPRILIGVGREENLYNFIFSLYCREHEGGMTVIITRIDIDIVIKQRFHHRPLPETGSDHQGGNAPAAPDIGASIRLQQYPGCRILAG